MPSGIGRCCYRRRQVAGLPVPHNRRFVEGIIWRYRVGAPWREVPREFDPWQTLWKRHRRYLGDGMWDKIHTELLADAAGRIDWPVSVLPGAYQHATSLPRDTGALSSTRICAWSLLITESAGRGAKSRLAARAPRSHARRQAR